MSVVWPGNFVKAHVPTSSWCRTFGRGRNMVRVTKRQLRRDMGDLRADEQREKHVKKISVT